MVDIYIWGSGIIASEFTEGLKNYNDKIEIIGYVESTPSKTHFMGKNVISPEELIGKKFDYLIIANTHKNEIYNTCLEKGIDVRKIVCIFSDISRELNICEISKLLPDFIKHCTLVEENSCISASVVNDSFEEGCSYYLYDPGVGGTTGFFAAINNYVENLAFAYMLNLKPYIVFPESFVYYKDKKSNAFEAFFEQNNSFSAESDNVIYSSQEHKAFFFGGGKFKSVRKSHYEVMEDSQLLSEYTDRAGKIFKKYFSFNEETRAYLKKNISEKIKGKTLGVHVRMGEWTKIQVPGHPQAVELSAYTKYINDVLEKSKYEYIFLATDEEKAIDYFRESFRNVTILYYDDVFRNKEDGMGILFTENKREMHNFLLGLEVLRDAETLAMCDGLITGISNIALYVRYRKKSLNGLFCDDVIIKSKLCENNAVNQLALETLNSNLIK